MGASVAGASSGLHHDFHDNLYVLLRGTKRFRLFPPAMAHRMYPHGTVDRIHPNGRCAPPAPPSLHVAAARARRLCRCATARARVLR